MFCSRIKRNVEVSIERVMSIEYQLIDHKRGTSKLKAIGKGASRKRKTKRRNAKEAEIRTLERNWAMLSEPVW